MKRTKRTLLSLLLAALLCMSLAAPASAAGSCRRQSLANGLQNILRSAVSENFRSSLLRRLTGCSGSACPNAQTPSAPPVEAPTETPVEAPVEIPVEVPAQTPVEAPAQNAPQTNTQSGDVLPQEAAVVELVNQQRAAYGLQPLTISAELCKKARMKSQDMAQNRYFDHNSPTYGSPFDMMRSLGINYRSAGENIAMGYSTAQAVMQGWMNSEGHRANILSANFTTIGVGYVANGNYWTQWFIG